MRLLITLLPTQNDLTKAVEVDRFLEGKIGERRPSSYPRIKETEEETVMDPITTAILAALSAGAMGGVTELSKTVITETYQKLKDVLITKFGPKSKVVSAIAALEEEQDSKGRQLTLQEQIINAKADQDQEIVQVAQLLLSEVRRQPGGEQHFQSIMGDDNVQQRAGRDAFINHINGRTGLVVFMVIVLFTIFVFFIWQVLPSIRQIVVSITASTPIPTLTPAPTYITATPAGTLTGFCDLVRASRSDRAYQYLYSEHLKNQVTPQKFNMEWGFFQNPSISCISTINSSSKTTATGTITATRFSTNQNDVYNVTLIEKDGQWEIDSMQKQ